VFDDALSSRLCLAVGVDLVVAKAEGLTGLVKAVQQLVKIDSRINGQSLVDEITRLLPQIAIFICHDIPIIARLLREGAASL
jgi:hypothetical protein